MMFILVSFIINSKSYLWPLYVVIVLYVLCTYLNAPAPVPNLSPGKEEKRNVYDTYSKEEKGKERKKKEGLASFVE